MMRFVFALLVCLVFVPSVVRAQPLLKIETTTAAGGVPVWFVQDKSLPLVTMSFAFRGGSETEATNKQGTTQLLSTMLDEGAGDMDAKAFQGMLRDKSIALSFTAGRDQFAGSMRFLSRHRDTAADLLHLALTKPRFDADSIARMREANIAELREKLADPDFLTARLNADTVYGAHPYRHNARGTIESLQKLGANDLHTWMGEHLTRGNLVVSFAGDIDARSARELTGRIFGDLPAGASRTAIGDTVFPKDPVAKFAPLPIPQTAVDVTWPAFGRKDKDWFALSVMEYILGGGGFSSRLMAAVRDQNGLTYGISSGVNDLEHAATLTVSTKVKGQDADRAMALINTVVQGLQDKPVTDAELKDAQSYLTGAVLVGFSSTGRIAEYLTSLQLDNLGTDWLDRWVAGVDAVTAADVQRVAKRVFGPAPQTTLSGARPNLKQPFETVTRIPNVEHPDGP